MMKVARYAVVVAGVAVWPSVAAAQRFDFERRLASPSIRLDVRTIRGRIDIVAADRDDVLVAGTAAVRVGVDVPADAIEIAKRIADNPPIELASGVLRLRPPAPGSEQHAVTLSYRVTVPRGVAIAADSDSGATHVSGTRAALTVRTQSAAIALDDLGGDATVTSGSGGVTVATVNGRLKIETSSGRIGVTGMRGSLDVRTQSGAVDAAFSGGSSATVVASSSGVRLRGIAGGAQVTTQSGQVVVGGSPSAPWDLRTGSGRIEMSVPGDNLTVDLRTGSGSIVVHGATINGSVDKRAVSGTSGNGSGHVTASSRSGSIALTAGRSN